MKRQNNLDGSNSEGLNEAVQHSERQHDADGNIDDDGVDDLEDVDQGDVDDDDAGRGAPLSPICTGPLIPSPSRANQCTRRRVHLSAHI